MTDFDAVLALIALLADPAAAKARLAELQAVTAAADARIAEAAVAHAKSANALADERAKLAKLEARLREREVAVFESERKHERALDELRKWKRESAPTRLVQHMGTLTSEPDTTQLSPDPFDDSMAENMDLAPIATAPARPVRTIHRKDMHR
jgi:hypothetical protein